MSSENKKTPGRRSKLTDLQKEEIRKRLLKGERSSALAREYGVDDKVIRRIKSEASHDGRVPVEEVQYAAAKSLENDLSDPTLRPILEKMGVEDRSLFASHKADLMEITLQLSMVARYSAQNAHKLARIAQTQLSKIDEAEAESSASSAALMNAMAYQAAANEAAKPALKMFEIATKQPPPPPEDKPIQVIGGLPDDV